MDGGRSLTSFISLGEIFEIYRHALDGLRQQALPGQFEAFEGSFPRDPIYVAKALEATFGIEIFFAPTDFYKSLEIPEERRDFLSFYEYSEPNHQLRYI
jgi:hypothetical protein